MPTKTRHSRPSRLLVSAGLLTLALLPAFLQGARQDGAAAARPATNDRRPLFDRPIRLEETGATSANVSLGDVNGDGHLDVVLVKGRHWPLPERVLIGDGKGGFAPAQDLGPASDRSYSGVLVDLDGDADLDLVVSNDLPDPKLVYLNDGTGRFRVGSTFGLGEWSTRNVSVADMNGDSLPDIVVANRDPKGVAGNRICLNRGGGRFDDDCAAFSKESATTITPFSGLIACIRSTFARTARRSTSRSSIRMSPLAEIAISMLPASAVGAPALAEVRLTASPNSLAKTAVMMKKISRFITKSSIGARSIPVASPRTLRLCRRIRISVLEDVREHLRLPTRARLEVVDGVEARDADRESGQRADHRVRDTAGHRARVRRSAQRHRIEHLEHAADGADQAEQRR